MTSTKEIIDWDGFVEIVVARITDTNNKIIQSHGASDQMRRLFITSCKREIEIAQSVALRKAFEGLVGLASVDDAVSQAIGIITCIEDIRRITPYRDAPTSLVDSLALLRQTRQKALDHLHRAHALLNPIGSVHSATAPNYFVEIGGLIARINAEPFPMEPQQLLASNFDPQNLKRKGGAAIGQGAFNGWMIRELSKRLSPLAPKRGTAIAELLALADVHVTADDANRIMSRD